jgi:hypothetical protein
MHPIVPPSMFGSSEDLVPINLGDPGGRFLRFREVDRGKYNNQKSREDIAQKVPSM